MIGPPPVQDTPFGQITGKTHKDGLRTDEHIVERDLGECLSMPDKTACVRGSEWPASLPAPRSNPVQQNRDIDYAQPTANCNLSRRLIERFTPRQLKGLPSLIETFTSCNWPFGRRKNCLQLPSSQPYRSSTDSRYGLRPDIFVPDSFFSIPKPPARCQILQFAEFQGTCARRSRRLLETVRHSPGPVDNL